MKATKNIKNFINFMEFSLNFKFPKLLKKKSDTELLELYYKFSPPYWHINSPLRDKAIGATVIYVVGEEFKRRYPKNQKLQKWDYTEEINLFDIIIGG